MGQYRTYTPGDDPQGEDGDAKFVGVNARLAPDKLPPGFLADAVNTRLRTGEPETRLGVAKPAWLNVLSPGVDSVVRGVGTFYGVGVFQDPNGAEFALICADGQVYRHRQYTPRAQLSLPAGVKLLSRCVPVQAFNRVYLFRGQYLAPLVCTDIDQGFTDLLPRYNPLSAYQGFVQVEEIDADEVAFGPWQGVTSVTGAANTVTVVTPTEHGYVTGADIQVRGAVQTEYNGRVNITVLDGTTFTYPFDGTATPTATGTITISNNSNYWAAIGTKWAVTIAATGGGGAAVIATVTKANHGFAVGQYVTIAGCTGATAYFNGTWYIATVPGANTFTYILNGTTLGTTPATGLPTAQSSIVQAGQTPETNPEAWVRVWNILPNADEAVYLDNRLVVSTAYTPGADAYDDTSTYTKKDYLVMLDILDPLHFLFFNEFRINEGSADEIVALVKYNQDTIIIVKGSTWFVMSGITGDQIAPSLDQRGAQYGCCAPRSLVVAGINALFPSTKRGICALQQNQLGQTRSVDIPFSNDLERVIQRINWSYASAIRMAWHDDRLYCAVPLDGAAANNAILVYDFRLEGAGGALTFDFQSGQWEGYDTGNALSVLEFVEVTHGGKRRLCFLGADGYVNLMEECWEGDQVPDLTRPNGLRFEAIQQSWTTRGYTGPTQAQKSFKRLELALGVWNATFSLTAQTGGAGTETAVRSNVAFSRTRYLKPVGKADFVEGNANLDWDTPGRGDYSVASLPGGVTPGFGLGQFQEIVTRPSVRTRSGRYVQYTLNTTAGRTRLKAITTAASEGQRRNGILI